MMTFWRFAAACVLAHVASAAQLEVSYATGSPSAVVFTGAAFARHSLASASHRTMLATDEPTQRADAFEAFLGEYPGYGIGSHDVRLVQSQPDPHISGWTIDVYQQYSSGLQVLGAVLKVVYNNDQHIVAVNGVTVPNLGMLAAMDPKITQTDAIATAKSYLADKMELSLSGITMDSTDDTLCIWRTKLGAGLSGENYLVHRILLDDKSGSEHVIYVDALTGAVVDAQFFLHAALDRRVYNGVSSWYEGNSTIGRDQETVDVVESARTVHDLFMNMLNIDSYDGLGSPLVARARDDCEDYEFWSDLYPMWTGETGPKEVLYCPGYAPVDVMAHEWAHGYTDHIDGLFYYSQAGALHESFSFIVAAATEILDTSTSGKIHALRTEGSCHEHNRATETRWVIGETIPIPRTQPTALFPPLMDLFDPACVTSATGRPHPKTTDDMECGFDDNGHAHINAAIPSYAFALLSDGFSDTVSGIGIEKALNIYLRAKINCHTPSTTFRMHANCLQTACDNLANIREEVLDYAGNAITIARQDCVELTKVLDLTKLRATGLCDATNFEISKLYPRVIGMDGGHVELDISGPKASQVHWTVGTASLTALNIDEVPRRTVTLWLPPRGEIPDAIVPGNDVLPVTVSLDGINFESAGTITYYESPAITRLEPREGTVLGGNLTIHGQRFEHFYDCSRDDEAGDMAATCLKVIVDGQQVPILENSTTQLVVAVPPIADPKTVSVGLTLNGKDYYDGLHTYRYYHVSYVDAIEIEGCDLTPAFEPGDGTLYFECTLNHSFSTSGFHPDFPGTQSPDRESVDPIITPHEVGALHNITLIGSQGYNGDGLVSGPNLLEIYVTSVDGLDRTFYQVVLNRALSVNSYLESLDLLNPGLCDGVFEAFDRTQFSYNCNVTFTVEALEFRSVPAYKDAVVFETAPAALHPGSNVFTFRVVPENIEAEERLYTVFIWKEENTNSFLESLKLVGGGCILSPPFESEIYNYTCEALQDKTIRVAAEGVERADGAVHFSFDLVPGGRGAYDPNNGVFSFDASGDQDHIDIEIVVDAGTSLQYHSHYFVEVTKRVYDTSCMCYSLECSGQTRVDADNTPASIPVSDQPVFALDPATLSHNLINFYKLNVPWNIESVLCECSPTGFPADCSATNPTISSTWNHPNDTYDEGVGQDFVNVVVDNPTTFEVYERHRLYAIRPDKPLDVTLSVLRATFSRCDLNFSSLTYNYSCVVPYQEATVLFEAIPSMSAGRIIINGEGYSRPRISALPIEVYFTDLVVGEWNTLEIIGAVNFGKLTPNNEWYIPRESFGETGANYTVHIYRDFFDNTKLSNLTIVSHTGDPVSFSPPFKSQLLSGYVARVPFETISVDVAGELEHEAASITSIMYGVLENQVWTWTAQEPPLEVERPQRVRITVEAQNGQDRDVYDVEIIRAETTSNALSTLSIAVDPFFDSQTCALAFHPDQLVYDCYLERRVTTINVTAIAEDPLAIVAISDVDLFPGENLVEVTVTAQDHVSVRHYFINAYRAAGNARLHSLSVAGCAFDFSSQVTDYSCPDQTLTSFDVVLQTADSGATVQFFENDWQTGSLDVVALPFTVPGYHNMMIKVTAQNLVQVMWYSVEFVIPADDLDYCAELSPSCPGGTVCQDKLIGYNCTATGRRLLTTSRRLLASTTGRLSALSVSGCAISPAFQPLKTQYSCYLPYAETSATITATPAGVADIEFVPAGDELTFAMPGSQEVVIKVNGTDAYYLNVVRQENDDNMLQSLSLSGCALVPSFSPTVHDYTCELGVEVTTTTISQVPSDRFARVVVEGGDDIEYRVDNLARVTVEAQNTDKRVYNILITRKIDDDDTILFFTTSCDSVTPALDFPTLGDLYECELSYSPTNALDFSRVQLNSTRTKLFSSGLEGLLPGTNEASITALADDGVSSTEVNFVIFNGADPADQSISGLMRLAIPGCDFVPAFRTRTYEYNCTSALPNNVMSLTPNPSKLSPGSSVSHTMDYIRPYGNTLQLRVMSENMANLTEYTLYVDREPSPNVNLQKWELHWNTSASSTLVCDFLADGTDCTVSYASSQVGEFYVVAEAEDFEASIPPISFQLGQPLRVTVKASDVRFEQTYTATVVPMAANPDSFLTSLDITGCTLDPPFEPGVDVYACLVNRETATLEYATTQNALAAVTLLTEPTLYFGHNLVEIQVASESGSTSAYSIIVTRTLDKTVSDAMIVADVTYATLVLTMTVDVLDPIEVMDIIDNSVPDLILSAGFPSNRVAVVGVRPGFAADKVEIDFGAYASVSAEGGTAAEVIETLKTAFAAFQSGDETTAFSIAPETSYLLVADAGVDAVDGEVRMALVEAPRVSQSIGSTAAETPAPTATPTPAKAAAAGIDPAVTIALGSIAAVLFLAVIGVVIYCLVIKPKQNHERGAGKHVELQAATDTPSPYKDDPLAL